MPKYFACYKPHSGATMSFGYTAPDVGHALDKMLSYAGVSRPHPEDEYDLMEVVDNNKYVPVAQKFKDKANTLSLLPKEEVPPVLIFTEKQYTSYRDIE